MGCSLNAEQEASLNRAVNQHLSAMNDGRTLQFISEIHPSAVKYYKSKGDDLFKKHFTLIDSSEVYEPDYYQDPLIKTIESKGERLHVRYEVLKIENIDGNTESVPYYMYATSEDNGKSWYFLEEGDYFNNDIIPAKERLIEKNK